MSRVPAVVGETLGRGDILYSFDSLKLIAKHIILIVEAYCDSAAGWRICCIDELIAVVIDVGPVSGGADQLCVCGPKAVSGA
jgi:hypothetical protein